MVCYLEESEGTRFDSYSWALTLVDMITDARVLQADHVPRDIVHRDAELNHTASALQPLTDDKPAETVLLSGPSGTGKTCTARYVVERLREAVIDINTQYVNCWENYSRFKTLYQLLDGIEKTFDIHRQSTPTDVLLDRLHDYDGPPYVAILDEADQLDDEGILYDLYRTRRLTLVLIVNEANEFLTNLPNRVASRLRTSTRIEFDPYTNGELVSILQDRVKWGLRDGVITEEQLHDIAEQATGDARVAIGTLRAAARRADQQQLGSIPDSFIQKGVSEAKAEIKQKNVEMLRPDQRLLYEIIAEHGEIRPGELYERYEEQASNPRSRRMVRNYLEKLCHYNLIEAKGENRERTYQQKQNNTAGEL